MGVIHQSNATGCWTRKVLLGGAILGLGIIMGLPSAVANQGKDEDKGKGNAYAHKSQGFGYMTPYSRVARI
jgi:hypothetical protein